MDRTSRPAAGLRTTVALWADIRIGLISSKAHLIRFATKLLHQLRCPRERFALFALGDRRAQSLQPAIVLVKEVYCGIDRRFGVGVQAALDFLPNEALSLGGELNRHGFGTSEVNRSKRRAIGYRLSANDSSSGRLAVWPHASRFLASSPVNKSGAPFRTRRARHCCVLRRLPQGISERSRHSPPRAPQAPEQPEQPE
jgi:hypothetical protein